jgi:hypothetical protein
MYGVPISIFYDFMDDGPDPMQGEDNFGTLLQPYINDTVGHMPKPAFIAAATLQQLVGKEK